MIAGAGDELQGIKRGILELADAIAINKADGDNIERALSARQQYETAFHLITPPGKDWVPPVVTCSALTGDGLAEIYNLILVHRQKLLASGDLEKKRMAQARDWFWSLVREVSSNGSFKIHESRVNYSSYKTRWNAGSFHLPQLPIAFCPPSSNFTLTSKRNLE